MLNWNEFDLFYNIPNYKITSRDNRKRVFLNLCPFKIKKLNMIMLKSNLSLKYIWCDLLQEITKNNIFKKRINKYLFTYKRNYLFNIFYIYYVIFSKIININNNIRNKVELFLKNRKLVKYSGIQIRMGNGDLKEKQNMNSSDLITIVNMIKNNKRYSKWYVTGDSKEIKVKLAKIFKNIYLFSTNITKHYIENMKDYSIIVEHEILSKSNFFIISRSTYGLTALLKSGILLLKENLSYEIKNGKSYNIKDEFFNYLN